MGDQITTRRFQHCTSRLRTRYGLDMDIDEYEKLCQSVPTKGVGKTVNDKGDWEVWLPFKGDWVCAAYRPSERLISTFFPRPPPRPGQASEALPDRVMAEINTRANTLAAKIVDSRVAKAVESEVHNIRRRAGVDPAGPLTAPEVRGADLKWFKGKFAYVCALMDAGRMQDARMAAGALAAFRPAIQPSQDTDCEHLFANLVAAQILPELWPAPNDSE